jgi:VWFA-related protein
MKGRAIVVAFGTVAALAVTTEAAGQTAQGPAFKSTVDRVPVDVSVITGDGKPLEGLTAADFSLTIDGRPRRVASAEYLAAARDPKPAKPAAATYSTNADTGGRLILFLVDQASIGPGRGRPAMESAIRFISQLSAADKIALQTVPATTQIEFTRNHALVTAALPRLSGQADTHPTSYRIGVAEAIAAHQGDPNALKTVIERECGGIRQPEEADFCRSRVANDISGIASLVHERTQNTLGALRSLLDRLAQTTSPKTIVLVSEGLVLERVSDAAWIGLSAAKAQATIQVLHLESPTADASVLREPVSPGRDRALGRDGLELIASATRGSVFHVASSADNAFARLALELSGFYLLSFEPEPADRDGKVHKIKVSVPGRSGIDIRSRNEFSVDYARAKTDEEVLADALRSPLLATDIGLKVNAYTLKDLETAKLRVLVIAEIDRASNPDGHLALAFALTDSRGRVVASQMERELKSPLQADKTQPYTAFIVSDGSGPHTLKLAVLDNAGRRGSVEHEFTPALKDLGELRVADLLLAEDADTAGNAATPSLGGEFTSGVVNTYIELYSDVVETLKNASVMFEVAENENGRAMDGAVGRVRASSTESPNRRALEATFKTTVLPPGNYVIRAVVTADGQRLGHVTRPLRIGKPVAVTRASTGLELRATARPVTVPFTSRTERFDRSAVLTPQVVGFFMERMSLGANGDSSAVVEHARAGRFDDALAVLRERTGTVPAAFLSGLALYAKGELEPAAAKFRDALRMDSEFFPAAFYLGSCYAAGGRDDQAVGAWQLSLVTQSDAAFIFTLLGDALLRLREADQAIEVLNEAAAQWPNDEEVQVRLGAAFAMSGKRAEALEKLEPYLATHPQDHERHFVALRTLFDAHAAKAPVRSRDEDRALFAKWAAAYAAAKGPHQPLVDQWQRGMSK